MSPKRDYHNVRWISVEIRIDSPFGTAEPVCIGAYSKMSNVKRLASLATAV